MNLPDLAAAAKRKQTAVKYIYEERGINPLFQGKKYFIRTFGCQMNVHDSEEIKALLEALGYVETEVFAESNLIILNTCAIRENAEDKVFGFLGRCKNLKKQKEDLIVALCGCMAQEEATVNKIMEKYEYVDLVFGTHNINELPSLLENLTKNQTIAVYSKAGDVIEFNNEYTRDSKITAWVNIMYGCDKFCTYCIVPYTRGQQRSRKPEDIIKEVTALVKAGYQEITLLGQNVNAYGKDLTEPHDFSYLLEMVSDTGIPRIRFVTSHPWDFTDAMIKIIAERPNIMPFIHLPIQSGSNRILKLMNRKYTKEDYLTLVSKIRQQIPDVAITTDIIVGFPGETEADFEETIAVARECTFDGAFTFIFSPRTGTPAAKMPETLTVEEKKQRLQAINAIINDNSLMSNQKTAGTMQKVLITGPSEKNPDKVCGYTETMKLVNFEAPKEMIGQIVNVEITVAKSFSLEGKLR